MSKIESLMKRAKALDDQIADLQRKLDEARLLQAAVKQMIDAARQQQG